MYILDLCLCEHMSFFEIARYSESTSVFAAKVISCYRKGQIHRLDKQVV